MTFYCDYENRFAFSTHLKGFGAPQGPWTTLWKPLSEGILENQRGKQGLENRFLQVGEEEERRGGPGSPREVEKSTFCFSTSTGRQQDSRKGWLFGAPWQTNYRKPWQEIPLLLEGCRHFKVLRDEEGIYLCGHLCELIKRKTHLRIKKGNTYTQHTRGPEHFVRFLVQPHDEQGKLLRCPSWPNGGQIRYQAVINICKILLFTTHFVGLGVPTLNASFYLILDNLIK